MPLYEYKCEKCKNTKEVYKHTSKEPHPNCENCGTEMRRVLHPSAVIYKAGGFYTTEYGKGKQHLEKDKPSK
ncbi:MAG: hypothetical protein A2008_11075 [Candidatus Wallbacteria bacterium GWC2_49_35]|uniref:Putative regulatory protein FmdB zinc ribbon domain-containing protein n=1 Tax=Candidatus Wallbacteria bacterium GWC2_49_35 TaxID=1817813 RepID=A0A1F7WK82_9BACT|nr:MAG: hypothetical protein A2008_11075 [Candidatus Wallbacteria bacterium GWC2_49_35]HBC76706.1 FmdB family transcriptional regulator [Candidatus Wallbacteria bacterium]